MFNKSKNTEFLLLSGEGTLGLGHLQYWVPQFIKARVNFSILVRNYTLLKLIKREYRTLNVLLAKSALDIEETFSKLTNLKTIFYMSNPINNIHSLRFNQYQHIFLGSENSDRDAQVTKVLRGYDELWLSSQSSIDKLSKFLDTDNLIIKKIGKPQLHEIIANSHIESKANNILITISKENNIYSNSIILKDILENIPMGNIVNFVFDKSIDKKSALYRDFEKQLSEFNLLRGQEFLIHYAMTNELIARSKYIICDVNNYKQSFLASNALICLYKPESMNLDSIFEGRYISFSGIAQFSSGDEIPYLIDNSENLFDKQKEFAEYWVGNSFTVETQFRINIEKFLN